MVGRAWREGGVYEMVIYLSSSPWLLLRPLVCGSRVIWESEAVELLCSVPVVLKMLEDAPDKPWAITMGFPWRIPCYENLSLLVVCSAPRE